MTAPRCSPDQARLGDSTWTELAVVPSSRRLLAVPIGSCEQHGPHLPLDTDTRIAGAVAAGLSAAIPLVMVAPALAITASGEHQGFAGTLSIGSAALEMVLIELVRSAQWSAGVIFVNGHGGNAAAVTAAVDVLNKEGRRVLSWWPRIQGGDAHAGRTETSLMMAIAPANVRVHAIEPGRSEPLPTLMATLRAKGVAAISPNGVLGDPRGASASEGAELLATLVADVIMQVNAWIAQ